MNHPTTAIVGDARAGSPVPPGLEPFACLPEIRLQDKGNEMGKPRNELQPGQCPISAARGEICSGMSALNMESNPMIPPVGEGRFLTEIDRGVAHAYEHLSAALHLLSKEGMA